LIFVYSFALVKRKHKGSMIYLAYLFKTAFANVREEMDNMIAEANLERIKKVKRVPP